MRRGARALLYLGTIAIVMAVGKYHAAAIGEYDFTGSSRFAWSLAYAALLALAAYGIGLPDVPRTNGSRLASAVGAAAAAAVGISLAQLAGGSALLPRFVVFWSAVLLVPIYVACSLLAARGATPGRAQGPGGGDRRSGRGGRVRHRADPQP